MKQVYICYIDDSIDFWFAVVATDEDDCKKQVDKKYPNNTHFEIAETYKLL